MKYKLIFFSIIIIYIIWLILRNCNSKINFPCFWKKKLLDQKQLSGSKIFDMNNDNIPFGTKTVSSRISRYPDVLRFIGNLNNYRYVNKPAYINIVENLNNFLEIYEDVTLNHLYHCGQNIDVAMDCAKNAQFHLGTIFLSLDPEGTDITKLEVQKYELAEILGKYLERMQLKCSRINILTSNHVLDGPKARNYYAN